MLKSTDSKEALTYNPTTTRFYAFGSLASLSLAMLIASLGTSSVNVALPTLTHAFSASFQAVQWVVIAYLLTITVLVVSMGRLGDIFGRRRLMLFGLLIFTAASALCGGSPSLGWLVAARAAQGVGASVLMALTIALVGETVAKERTGSAMGLLGTMSAIGTALGPSLGGLMITSLGWQAIFYVNIPIGLLAFWLSWHFLPADSSLEKPTAANFDILGILLLTIALGFYALAMTTESYLGSSSTTLLMAAAIGAGLFLIVEVRAKSPLIRLSAFHDIGFSAGLIMNMLVATVMMATLVVGPFFLSRSLGLSETLVGAVIAVGPVISTLSGIPSGRIADRFGSATIVVIGLALMAGGSAGLAILPAYFGVGGYIAALFVLTPGYQLFLAANNTAVMMGVDKAERGIMSGMLTLARNLGLVTGASVMGAVFAFGSGTKEVSNATPEAIAQGMQTTFFVSTALLAVALLVAFTLAAKALRRPSINDTH